MSEEKNIYIKKGFERIVRTVEMLKETNDLSVGQVFNTVASTYEKSPSDYDRWISFEENRSEFNTIKSIVDEFTCDLDKLNWVCEWLDEEAIG